MKKHMKNYLLIVELCLNYQLEQDQIESNDYINILKVILIKVKNVEVLLACALLSVILHSHNVLIGVSG